jgi:hypothetical protein
MAAATEAHLWGGPKHGEVYALPLLTPEVVFAVVDTRDQHMAKGCEPECIALSTSTITYRRQGERLGGGWYYLYVED